jgi:c(7)-type cytochrome triheme protein
MRRLPRIRLTFWRVAFLLIFAIGLYATIVRFGRGLGAASGLSNGFPWGIWIGFDVMCGVALAAGGFTVAAIVYVMGLKKYEPILRPSVLTAFLGYVLVAISLLYDLGRPYRIWHPLVFGNHHSVMFEVAWCVTLYLTVLALEFSPVVLERFRLVRALKVMHAVTPVLVIIGVLLSTLHQSSLGTLYVIAPNKLHGLWYTPMLPVLFWLSAIAVGLSMTIFESTLSHRAFGVSLHKDLLGSLGRWISVVLGVYFVVRIAPLAQRGALGLVFEGSTESHLFLLEMLVGVVLPALLFLSKRVRSSHHGLFYSAVLVVLGVVLNRLNVSITGIERYAGNVYFPTFLEAMTSVFVMACGFFIFGLIAKYFAVFPKSGSDEHAAGADEHAEHAEHAEAAPVGTMPEPGANRSPVATWKGALILVTLIGVFGAVAMFEPEATPAIVHHQVISTGLRKLSFPTRPTLDVPPDYHFPRAANSPGPVVFSHERHITSNANPCTNCHPKPYKMAEVDVATIECEYGKMSGCGHCHDGSESFDIKQGCRLCHQRMGGQQVQAPKDMALPWRLADGLMVTQDREFGPVFFSHSGHVTTANLPCSDCHPAVYKMKRTAMRDLDALSRDAFIEWGHRCKVCHDGRRAFNQEDKCAACHTRWRREQSAAACALVDGGCPPEKQPPAAAF